jgi:hypothetical protein
MSPYGTLTVTYTAQVFVPGEVYDAFYFTREFGRFARNVAKDANKFGELLDEEPNGVPSVQWADFFVRRDAEDFINNWHNRILQWQEELRSRP